MMKAKGMLIGAMAVLAVGQGLLSAGTIFPKWSKNYSPQKEGLAGELGPDQLLFALAGFRELIAGILWVRADTFFETGNYDAILPIIRLVTWLDPKQIDVYSTGMWHIGYNFTDEEQRSDRRYIPSALALGKEGAEKNDYTYEMFFETGWMWYHKVQDDFPKAVDWFLKAQEREDMQPARKNVLGMAYQRTGQPDKALETYLRLYKESDDLLKKEEIYSHFQNRETLENNADNTIVRMIQRGWVAQKDGQFAAANYDTKPPFDVQFSARVTVEEARVIRVEGFWGVRPVGTRVRFILRDSDYPDAIPGGMIWDKTDTVSLDPPRNRTWAQDDLFVRNQRFNRKLDLSKDPTMYSFVQPEYTIEFYYNPRIAPPHIQDKFGWSGEGMTDKNFLRTDVREGCRVIFTQLKLTRDQILRRGEWADKVPIVQTKNFVAPKNVRTEDEVLVTPGILSEPLTPKLNKSEGLGGGEN